MAKLTLALLEGSLISKPELVDGWWLWLCTFLTLPISHVVYLKNFLGLNDPLLLKHITCDSTVIVVLLSHVKCLMDVDFCALAGWMG